MGGRMELGWCLAVSVVVVSVLVVNLPASVQAGCVKAGLCCQGKNATCRTLGPRVNDSEKKTCFCDEGCIYLGDCCTDYSDNCQKVDCELGDWEPWGKCSKDCGWGKKTRARPILKKALNGGTPCKPTEERVFCYGWSCKSPRHSRGSIELRETGKIIPATYGTWRKSKTYNPYKDIRRNLFYHYSANQIIRRPVYCARFEVTHARHSCARATNPWSKELKKGAEVCVECQQLAMKRKLGIRCKGHGVFQKETRWTAFTVPGCHGKWIMKSEHRECTCNPKSDNSFILV